MHEDPRDHRLPLLTTDAKGRSIWTAFDWPSESRSGMLLSPRIACSSMRLRKSEPGYFADWHVAGEPVLIVIQRGTLRIGLHDAEPRDFHAGQAFIAADALSDGATFDPMIHGHTAEVVGETNLQAIHIKLTDFSL